MCFHFGSWHLAKAFQFSSHKKKYQQIIKAVSRKQKLKELYVLFHTSWILKLCVNVLIGREVCLGPLPGFQMITHGLKSTLFSKGVRILFLLVLISFYLDPLQLSGSPLSNA